jgi:hypothetical protein
MRRNSCPWEKKAFTKRRKNTRSFFSCPQFRTARIFALWRTLNAGAQRSSCCCLEHHRSPSNALSLAHSLFVSISFYCFICLLVLFVLVFFGRLFLFLFFGETKSARNGSHRCWWQASWRNSVLFELRWQAYGFPYIRVLEGEEGGSRCCSRCLHSDLQVRSTAFALMCSTLFTPQLLYMFFYLVCLWIFFFFCLWDDDVSLTSWDCYWKMFVVRCLWSNGDVDTLFLIKRSTLLCLCSFP